MLEALLSIEAGFGRVRFDDPSLRYAPRTLDCDLLACGDQVRATQRLTLPHPAIAMRDFVLQPLADLEPEWVHPTLGKPVGTLIADLPEITAQRL